MEKRPPKVGLMIYACLTLGNSTCPDFKSEATSLMEMYFIRLADL